MNTKHIALPLLLLSLTPISLAASSNVEGYINGEPYIAKYPDTKTTGYYIPNGTGEPWLKALQGSTPPCFTGSNYWCIPQEDRGFYTEVKVQGTGIRNGKVYHYSTIKRSGGGQPRDSITGLTNQQTRPEPNHTIAVNQNPDSKCYIPPGSKVYIDTNDQFEGTYVAEDTGGLFDEEGTTDTGDCKIDIYTGIGDDALKKAEEATAQDVPVYLLSWQDNTVAPPDNPSRTTRHATGATQSKYQNTERLKAPATMWTIAQQAKQRSETCDDKPYEQRKQCIQTKLSQINQNHAAYNVSTACSNTEKPAVSPIRTMHTVVDGMVLSSTDTYYIDDQARRTFRVLHDKAVEAIPLAIDQTKASQIESIDYRDYIKVETTNKQNIQQRKNVFNRVRYNRITVDNQQNYLTVKELGPKQRRLRNFLLNASDCTTSQKLCVCNIQHPKTTMTYANGTASHGKIFLGDDTPYNFDIVNGSHITTSLTEQNAEQLLKSPSGFKQRVKDAMNKKQVNKTFTSPATGSAYLLHAENKLAFLKEKPEWYAPSGQTSKLTQRYTSLLDKKFTAKDIRTLFSIGSGAGITTNLIQSQVQSQFNQPTNNQPRIPSCEPQKRHQTICVKHNPGSPKTPVNTTQQQATKLPPLRFTLKI